MSRTGGRRTKKTEQSGWTGWELKEESGRGTGREVTDGLLLGGEELRKMESMQQDVARGLNA